MNPDANTAGNDTRAVQAGAVQAGAVQAGAVQAGAVQAGAVQAWAGMQAFLAGEDRRRVLRAELDLGPGKAELLIRLADAPLTLREIAQAVDADPSAATVAVDRLERRGLVRRGPHPEDNRRKLVHLTDAGRRAAATAQRILTDPPAALAALSEDDLSALTRIFAALNSGTEPPAGHPRPDDQIGR